MRRLPPASTIALYGSSRQEGYVKDIVDFIDRLSAHGLEVAVHEKLAATLRAAGMFPDGAVECRRMPADADVAVSIGGDGTFLRTARWVGRSGVPVMGINTGHLGFLAGSSIEHVGDIADILAAGGAVADRRFMLKVECDALTDRTWPYALNEIALLKEETASMINVDVEVDGCRLADYRADGLIVSTPTGSTAYNLSAGGPILMPGLECMVISAIAPHSLTIRPLVASGDTRLTAAVTSRSATFRLGIDGRSVVLPCGERLRISRADYSLNVAHMPAENFPETLRNKLHWNQ